MSETDLEIDTSWSRIFDSMVDSGDLAKMGGALAVYIVIKRFTRWKDGVAIPTVETIAEKAGLAKRQVLYHLKKLETMGYLNREKTQRKNHYSVREQLPIKDTDGKPVGVAEMPYARLKIESALTEAEKLLKTWDGKQPKIEGEGVVLKFFINIAIGDQNQVNSGDGATLQQTIEAPQLSTEPKQ